MHVTTIIEQNKTAVNSKNYYCQYRHCKSNCAYVRTLNALNDTKYYVADCVKYHMRHCETFSTQGPKKLQSG